MKHTSTATVDSEMEKKKSYNACLKNDRGFELLQCVNELSVLTKKYFLSFCNN